jgi:hypothetical protein
VNKRVIGILIAAATTAGSAAMAQEGPEYQPLAMPAPPPPPQVAPADYGAVATVAAPAPSGQWVYTNQYGWIWSPYDSNYTYVAGPGAAYTFAFYPHFGWRWMASPWVLGVGPSPFWGRLGPSRYAWYGHPGFRGFAPRGGWYGRPGVRVGMSAGLAYHPVYRAAPHGWGRSAPQAWGRAGGHRR